MQLRDVVNRAIYILGLESEVSVEVPSLTREKLVDCANYVLQELSLQYVHLRHKETLPFVGGRVYYSDFSHGVREILEIRVNGNKVPFLPNSLFVEANVDGYAEVSYIYYLDGLALNDIIELEPKYTEFVLATGVACEYYYRMGLVDEALYYKSRYELSIDNLNNKIRTIKLPKRRFL